MLKKHIYPFSMLALSIIGILLAYALAEEFYYLDLPQYDGHRAGIFTPISSQVCGEAGSFFSCESVSKSSYAVFFGFPVAIYGLMFYLITFGFGVTCWVGREPVRRLMVIALFWTTAIGLFIDIGLLLISYFQLKALCPLCLFTYGITLLLFGFTLIYMIKDSLNPLAIHKSRIRPSLVAGAVATLIVLSAAGSMAYAANHFLIRGRIEYIRTHKEQEIQSIVNAFDEQAPEQLLLPALLVHGNADAPVTLVEVSDFLCPYCARTAQIVDDLIKENPETVRVLFVNFPLDKTCNPIMRVQMHQGACELAKGAVCATFQGKLHDYQQVAFAARKKDPTMEDVRKYAAAAGLDLSALDQCLEDPKTEEALQWQIEAARNQGINATPTLFINGKRYKGRIYPEALQRIIDMEVNRMKDEK